MPTYSQTSEERLKSCHADLRIVFYEMIRKFDHTIIYGYRSPEEQFELFKRGRKEENGIWVIENKLEIVTYKDGYENKSEHNYEPSNALDAAPYPINWNDRERMCYFAGHIMERADKHGIKLTWGGDWDNDTEIRDHALSDLVHFERRS